jgi:hypothetical protein
VIAGSFKAMALENLIVFLFFEKYGWILSYRQVSDPLRLSVTCRPNKPMCSSFESALYAEFKYRKNRKIFITQKPCRLLQRTRITNLPVTQNPATIFKN